MQFGTDTFYFGITYKHYHTSDMLLLVLYIANKPKWIERVLPIAEFY